MDSLADDNLRNFLGSDYSHDTRYEFRGPIGTNNLIESMGWCSEAMDGEARFDVISLDFFIVFN